MSTNQTAPPASRINPAQGAQLKAEGMSDADEATDPSWASRCDAAIREMADRRTPFQASDLVREGLLEEPDDHHQWGARFGTAARRGVIKEYAVTLSNRTQSRRSRLVTWIGTR